MGHCQSATEGDTPGKDERLVPRQSEHSADPLIDAMRHANDHDHVPTRQPRVRLAEVVASLSLATDLATVQPLMLTVWIAVV